MGLFNLRAVFTADTKGVKQGSKEAQAALKEFEGTTESAIDNVAGLFETSMKEINSTLKTIGGGFLTLKKGIIGATEGVTGMTKAMRILKVAMTSLGIGAIVTALASLVAYFTKSQRGADGLARAMAAVKQVFATLTDYAINLGEKIATGIAWPIKKLRELIGSNNDEVKKTDGFFGNINDKVSRRIKLTERQQALERKNIDWIVEKAKLQQQIEQQREIVADKVNRSSQERLAANQKALALTSELYRKEGEMAQERLALIKEENALSESMNKDLEAEANAEVELLKVETERASRSKDLLSQQAEITNAVKKEREEAEKIANLKARKEIELTLPKVDDTKIQSLIPEFTIPVKLEISDEQFKQLQDKYKPQLNEFVFDVESTVEGMVSGMSQALGDMLAGFITGEGKLEDLLGSVVGMLGQALQQIGSALIAYGVSMEAFKKAFSNPYAAIAAGAALVAAGSMLSSLIGKLSSGGSSSTVGANAGLIAGGSTLSVAGVSALNNKQSQVNVNVTGTLVGQGSTLKAVISNEDKRKGLSS